MPTLSLENLAARLEVGEQLLAGQNTMFEPQDLPGRYGRVVASIDRVLLAIDGMAVLAGGWAVWRHGFFGRMTQDIDIVLPADRVEDFLRSAAVLGFEVLAPPAGRWPKVRHKETDVVVDILPEGATPGTAQNPAPTKIPHPKILGASDARLQYILLHALAELKLAAGRIRDDYDLVELIRANPDQVESVRRHLATVHASYCDKFDELVRRAGEQEDH